MAETAGKGQNDLMSLARQGTPLRLGVWRRRVRDPSVAEAALVGPTPQRMLGNQEAAMTLNVYASLFENDLDDGRTGWMRPWPQRLRPQCGLRPPLQSRSVEPTGPISL